jgi:hypothetical protein
MAVDTVKITVDRLAVDGFVNKKGDFFPLSLGRQIRIFVAGKAVVHCLGTEANHRSQKQHQH